MYAAWDLSVSLMEIGEVAQIKSSPRFAYGKMGRYVNTHVHAGMYGVYVLYRSPDVPSNASITYELELLEVQEPLDFTKVTEKELNTLM